MKSTLALFGACVLGFLAYSAGTMKYECVTPAHGPIADGSGRWFYMCLGPSPSEGQRAGLGEAARRFGAPTPQMAR